MNDFIILKELRAFVEVHGSQKNAARALGISAQHLSDLLRGRKNISKKVASGFGYHAEWVKRDPTWKIDKGSSSLWAKLRDELERNRT